MFILQSARPLKLITSLGLAVSIALLGACSSSDPTKVEADFQINSVKGTVSGQNVTIDLTAKEACTDLTNLVADVEAYGASVSPDPKVARDYSQPVKFTVTAPDGTKVVYTVTVKGNSCDTYTPVPTPTPTVVPCTAAPTGTTGYSLVFKGCDANNVATYYDKTECVRDNATGLIWQGHMPAGSGHLRANDQYKTNFDSTEGNQNYNNDNPIPVTAQQIADVSNSIGFKNAVNASNLCGSDIWRLPTKDELLGLVKTSEAPKIDNEWFLNTPQYAWYWTSSGYLNYAYIAWYVFFLDGSAGAADREYNKGYYSFGSIVRLVR